MMDINRLKWASRRGMLELDLILMPFLENVFPNLSENEQGLYEKLMRCEDQDMFNWFIYRHEPDDPEVKIIVDIIRDNLGIRRNA